ncbi:MAG: hypothetical protein ABIG46_02300 [Candidatus Omnitrophota bacterium]|nr:hypothetical protein [Candidatus Omnitrophota bacterium]
MKTKSKVLILGDGRIARGVFKFLLKNHRIGRVAFYPEDKDVSKYDILIGALPGALGENCLKTALKFRKNLIDISDIDPPFYLRYEKAIAKKGILVIPGCGISPGLVNAIIGRELADNKNIREIEIKAGSLSKSKFCYPFLWCFEDIVLCHKLSSWQFFKGKKKKCFPFSGYIRESFFGQEAESYYCASGFENLMDYQGLRNFSYRVVRPRGFMDFFKYLESYGFFRLKNLATSKRILESKKSDNITFAELNFSSSVNKVRWLVKSSSSRNEAMNSMQKVTCALPAVVADLLLEGEVNCQGLLFMEELGKQEYLFKNILNRLKDYSITIEKKLADA